MSRGGGKLPAFFSHLLALNSAVSFQPNVAIRSMLAKQIIKLETGHTCCKLHQGRLPDFQEKIEDVGDLEILLELAFQSSRPI